MNIIKCVIFAGDYDELKAFHVFSSQDNRAAMSHTHDQFLTQVMAPGHSHGLTNSKAPDLSILMDPKLPLRRRVGKEARLQLQRDRKELVCP